MRAFGAIMLAITSAAAGAVAAAYAMKKREEIEQYDYDFDDDDETYFNDMGDDLDQDLDDLGALDGVDLDPVSDNEDRSGEDF